ncbi:MAG: urease accessory protein UreG, partial [Thaumarchaeota archaeon]|nr:urease accessory protein UreG [Nitrososphaerota archaeon]
RDGKKIRIDKTYLFLNCKTGEGIEKLADRIISDLLFDKELLKSTVDK